MTIQELRFVHCDFAGCDRSDPEPNLFAVPDGWIKAVWMHGCPEHADAVMAHKATIEPFSTRGRRDPYREPAAYVLHCACGWSLGPLAAVEQRRLKEDHLRHVEVTAAMAGVR